MRALRQAAHAEAVEADLQALETLRHYLIFKRQVHIPIEALKDAIDDYMEQLTGDRRALHDQHHSIGR